MNEIELREIAQGLMVYRAQALTRDDILTYLDASAGPCSASDIDRVHELIMGADVMIEFPAPEDVVIVRHELLMSLVDTEPCSFDHHGGCQAHGYHGLQPGEICPQAELQDLINRPTL